MDQSPLILDVGADLFFSQNRKKAELPVVDDMSKRLKVEAPRTSDECRSNFDEYLSTIQNPKNPIAWSEMAAVLELLDGCDAMSYAIF